MLLSKSSVGGRHSNIQGAWVWIYKLINADSGQNSLTILAKSLSQKHIWENTLRKIFLHYYQQLLFKHFVKLFLISKLLSKVPKIPTTISKVSLDPSNDRGTFSKDFWKTSIPCHVHIHWIALAEYSQMSTQMTGCQSFLRFFASFCIGQISHEQQNG